MDLGPLHVLDVEGFVWGGISVGNPLFQGACWG